MHRIIGCNVVGWAATCYQRLAQGSCTQATLDPALKEAGDKLTEEILIKLDVHGYGARVNAGGNVAILMQQHAYWN